MHDSLIITWFRRETIKPESAVATCFVKCFFCRFHCSCSNWGCSCRFESTHQSTGYFTDILLNCPAEYQRYVIVTYYSLQNRRYFFFFCVFRASDSTKRAWNAFPRRACLAPSLASRLPSLEKREKITSVLQAFVTKCANQWYNNSHNKPRIELKNHIEPKSVEGYKEPVNTGTIFPPPPLLSEKLSHKFFSHGTCRLWYFFTSFSCCAPFFWTDFTFLWLCFTKNSSQQEAFAKLVLVFARWNAGKSASAIATVVFIVITFKNCCCCRWQRNKQCQTLPGYFNVYCWGEGKWS